MNKPNYYNILDIDEDANKDQIKRAYRKLSLKYHPDKTNNDPNSNEEYLKITEAYEILSDEVKKQKYDIKMNLNQEKTSNNNCHSNYGGNLGMPRISRTRVNDNTDKYMYNMFNPFMFSSHNNPFNICQSNSNGNSPTFVGLSNFEKPSTIIKELSISLEQSYTGCDIPVEIDRWVLDNNVAIPERITYYVNIYKGIDDNETIILKNKGNVVNEQVVGDVKIFIKIINKTAFDRKGIDLILEKTISLKESLCGFNFEFTHLNGNKYYINNSPGNIVSPEFKKVIPGMGIIRDEKCGSLIILFHVNYPNFLSENTIKQLDKIL